MASVVKQTEVRDLGKTELNWVAAVETGTGITITSILFERRVPVADLKRAVSDLLALHPRLRSLIVGENRTFVFRTPAEVYVRLSEIEVSSEAHEEDGGDEEPWHSITVRELNSAFSKEYPVPVFQPKVYLLGGSHSLLVLRVHAAAADMASTPTMVKQIVSSLFGRFAIDNRDVAGGDDEALPSVEDAVPPGQANKPFWAHGVDVVGYGLSSRRHAYLPFDDTDGSRTSKLIRAALTVDATNLLLKECEKRGVSVYGAVIAAALKAVAAYKRVGARGEHYGTTVLMQCRRLLQPPLPDSAIGFYHSALLRTIHTTEPEPFWELATRCSQDLDNAVQNRKHFTDMSDLNGLMEQAMRFPYLTPSGSMRTSALSTMFDPVVEDLGEEAAAVGVKDYMSCSSTHGVGPCLALFPFMRQGSLQFSFVYPSPLFSRPLMQNLVDSILFYLSEDEPLE